MPLDVLVVEDDETYRALLRRMLGSMGLAAVAVGTAEEGFRRAMEDRPRLLITDVHLPGENGFELCRRVKASPDLANTAVLIVTGTYNKDEAKMMAARGGADAYLRKPFHLPELLAVVRRLLGGYPK